MKNCGHPLKKNWKWAGLICLVINKKSQTNLLGRLWLCECGSARLFVESRIKMWSAAAPRSRVTESDNVLQTVKQMSRARPRMNASTNSVPFERAFASRHPRRSFAKTCALMRTALLRSSRVINTADNATTFFSHNELHAYPTVSLVCPFILVLNTFVLGINFIFLQLKIFQIRQINLLTIEWFFEIFYLIRISALCLSGTKYSIFWTQNISNQKNQLTEKLKIVCSSLFYTLQFVKKNVKRFF